MIANGIFLSKLIYLIKVWGGCSDFLLDFLQIQQNRAARYVTKLGRGTPLNIILMQCEWLSVRQLAIYHNLNVIYKTKRDKNPKYFSDKSGYQTRLARGSRIRTNKIIKKTLTQQNFTYKSTKIWNKLPNDIRMETTELKFKQKIKAWIRSNVSI